MASSSSARPGRGAAPYAPMDVDIDLTSLPMMADSDFESDPEDPVVGSYDVYLTPQAEATKPQAEAETSSGAGRRNVYLLQFPNRAGSMPYRDGSSQAPLDVRVKPRAGFLEMDVSAPSGVYMDRGKAVKWSKAMRDAAGEGITEFGMSAGFTSRVVSARTGFGQTGDQTEFERETEVQNILDEFEQSERKGRVLNRQTLGGQILKNASGRPFYMIGAFRNDTLHLSPLTGVVQLRPQFHYLDAQKKLENLRRRKEAAGPNEDSRQPKAIQQMVKSADDDGNDTGDTKSFLQAAQDEPWIGLPFVSEDTNLAYEAYNEWLFVNDTESAVELESMWTDREYIDAISVPHFDPIARTRRRPLTKEQIKQLADEKDGR